MSHFSHANRVDQNGPEAQNPRFPFVLDFLQDDKKTLKQCSLVSHQWREAARARLFRVVVLSDCLQYLDFKDSVVLTQRPVLANIRHLTIEASTGHYFHQTPDEPEYPLSLISALPNLETLQLQGSLPRQGLFVETIRRVPQKQFKLKKLALLCGDSFRASNYVRYVLNVLGMFSQIDFLTVSHGPDSEIESQTRFEISDLAEYIKAFQSYNHHIEKLLVGKVKVQVNTRSADLRFWFQVLYHICQLSELAELYIEKPSDLPSVDAYRIPQPYDLAVSDIAQNLRVLRVQIGDIRALALEAYRRSVHFRTCYHLTEFYLEARGHALEPPNPNQNSSWVVFGGIINSLPPAVNRTLRSLKIHWNFRGPLPRVYQGYNWEPLKVVLRRFRALRVVAFADPLSQIRPPQTTAAMAQGLHQLLALPDRVAVELLPEGMPFSACKFASPFPKCCLC